MHIIDVWSSGRSSNLHLSWHIDVPLTRLQFGSLHVLKTIELKRLAEAMGWQHVGHWHAR